MTRARQSGRTVGLFAVLLTLALQAGAAEPWWTLPADAAPAAAAELPAEPAWLLPRGTLATNLEGRAVILGGARPTTLVRQEPVGPDTDVDVVFRLAPEAGKTARVELRAAVSDDTNAPAPGIACSAALAHGDTRLNWNATDPDADHASGKTIRSGSITLLNGSMRQLDWPDNLRRLVEAEAASLAPWSARWQRLRIRLRRESYQVWLNDTLLVNQPDARQPTAGGVKVTVASGALLAGVSVRAAAPEAPGFWPVRLGDRVNARALGQKEIPRAALPRPGEPALVHAIPFVFPEPDSKGRDHVDLAASWLQGGYLEDGLEPQTGPFMGRWAGTAVENPARIQFRIPTGRYHAIHLIAASDGDPDSVPLVTAQFYRPRAGFPENLEARVPLFTETSTAAKPLPVELEGGGQGRLYLVTIPINPGRLTGFQDLPAMEVELTKAVQLYRAYPDPMYYSAHGAGRPSGVHVYAMTLEEAPLTLELEPDAWGYVWTAPDKPALTARVRNRSGVKQEAALTLMAVSLDGTDRLEQTRTATVAPGKAVEVRFTLDPKRYGHYAASLALEAGAASWTEPLGIAYLHRDTRERGNWERGMGQLFGSWLWHGGHHTYPLDRELLVMGLAGADGLHSPLGTNCPPALPIAKRFGMQNLKRFASRDIYETAKFRDALGATNEETAVSDLIASLRSLEAPPSPLTKPMLLAFYPEPQVGVPSYGTRAEYLGLPGLQQMTDAQIARARAHGRAFAVGARAVKKEWPGTLCVVPHGDPMYAVSILEHYPEAREVFDGVAADNPGFERLPEQQIHQVSLHRYSMFRREMARMGVTNIFMPMYEGTCHPVRPGALTLAEQADLNLRATLILMAYGVDAHLGGWVPFDSGDYWGEQHYGSGIFERRPIGTPRPAYAAYATMTRHLNRKNFDGWLPTGSLSVYALRFRHWKTGSPTLALWTIRGKRPVTFQAAGKDPVVAHDIMDNAVTLTPRDGKVTLTLSSSPVFVDGAAPDTAFTLGEPDHADAAVLTAAAMIPLGNPGDGSWTLSNERDADYEGSMSDFVRRIPGVMTAQAAEAPVEAGAKALAITLGPQAETNHYMPFYTTLMPAKPVVIPGKASHLGLWVRAASDWGRVVYALRDARGERWLSVGSKGGWNCDDIHNWSVFCFDGWRRLRFELPANSPYDTYRENGTTWWGHYGKGDGLVDLPLTLEKIMVERRTHAVHVNDAQPADPTPVLLAGLAADYADAADSREDTLRLARLRMPIPEGTPDLDNPIALLRETGAAQAPAITHVTVPDQDADGRRCFVHFPAVADAKLYEIWASPYPDGRGALNMTPKGWDQPGKLLRGFKPDTDFYLFLVVVDAKGKRSQPSPAHAIKLKDMFAMK